jgi:hypothetical protein
MLVYYTVDLGLNHVVKGWSDAAHYTSNMMFAVPGGQDGPAELLVTRSFCFITQQEGMAGVFGLQIINEASGMRTCPLAVIILGARARERSILSQTLPAHLPSSQQTPRSQRKEERRIIDHCVYGVTISGGYANVDGKTLLPGQSALIGNEKAGFATDGSLVANSAMIALSTISSAVAATTTTASATTSASCGGSPATARTSGSPKLSKTEFLTVHLAISTSIRTTDGGISFLRHCRPISPPARRHSRR